MDEDEYQRYGANYVLRAKFSRPGGFSGVFYTCCWNIVRHDVIAAVTHFFIGKLLRANNAYFLALIPKNQSPLSFANFRPISILNFSFKVISEILAKRLSDILPGYFKATSGVCQGEIHP